MMNNYRLEIEQLILITLLSQDKTNELDKMELEDYKLDFNLFKSNKTHKLVSKAIHNLQEQNIPISDITVEKYIKDHTRLNSEEFLDLYSKLWVTFDTMTKYVDHLKVIDDEEMKLNLLKDM